MNIFLNTTKKLYIFSKKVVKFKIVRPTISFKNKITKKKLKATFTVKKLLKHNTEITSTTFK